MKLSKSFLLVVLVAGMTLGTAWAIRGQFGHEQGAAWAGGIGALVLLLLAKRKDWYPKALRATLAGAIGWGLGGAMSYGIVVGYGRGSDFGNVYYGLMMLFVIGGLYGFLGGGLFGLALEDSKMKKVDWPRLFVEMVAVALVTYFFLIEQWGWLMTPPRSEMWAACLGLALGLSWYLVRNYYVAALRVAVFAGLGGGFGFAFGNFLHVLGYVSEIGFNFWNVMEYSLGFFGGVGMAYGTYTANWPQADPVREEPKGEWFPIMALTLMIPFVVWDQSFGLERLTKMATTIQIANSEIVAKISQAVALSLILGSAGYWINYYYFQKSVVAVNFENLRWFFFSYFSLYMVGSWLITGAFFSTYRVEQYLYAVNLLIIGWLLQKGQAEFQPKENQVAHWGIVLLGIGVIVAVLALIAIGTHGEIKGAQIRF